MKKPFLLLFILGMLVFSNAISCTIFSFAENGKSYFGNNEDYSNPDTEIRFYPAQDGKYAWVYLGFYNNVDQGGVNEKGLCWDWVAIKKNTGWQFDHTKETLKAYPNNKMQTECATVEEAIKFYEKYNEPSFRYARILIADKMGNSVIVGWKDGKILFQRNNSSLLVFGYGSHAVESYFSKIQGEKNVSYLAEALNAAHQEGGYPTQYSNVISTTDGKLYLYFFHNYCRYLEVDYLIKLKEGYSKYKLRDLFNTKKSCSGITYKKEESSLCTSKDTDGLIAYQQIYFVRQSPQNNFYILLFLIVYGLQTLFTIIHWPAAYFLNVMDAKEVNKKAPSPDLSQIWSFVICTILAVYLGVLMNFKEAFQVGMPQNLNDFSFFIRLLAHTPLVVLIMVIPLVFMNYKLLRQTNQTQFYKWHYSLNTISYLILSGLFIYWGFIKLYI